MNAADLEQHRHELALWHVFLHDELALWHVFLHTSKINIT